MASQESSPDPRTPKAPRIISVDALRGLDMFWIVGADHLAKALGDISDSPIATECAQQFTHVPWEGLHFYDVIFPLFIFLAGMSAVFSLSKYLKNGDKKDAYLRTFRRFTLLYLLGVFQDVGLSAPDRDNPLVGIVQRIAFCYLISALLFLNLKRRGLIIAFLVILIGYGALITFVPMPGRTTVSFAPNENIVNWFDLKFLPFMPSHMTYDKEGILSTFGAAATALLGVLAAMVIRDPSLNDKTKLSLFAGAGALMLLTGYLWSYQLPIIKAIWTSSFVLVSGGYCCLFLFAFYLIIDVWRFQTWAIPFIWIGANSLGIYMAREFVDFQSMGERLAGGPVAAAFGQYGQLLTTSVSILCVFIFARFLYKRKLFLRV